MARWTRLALLLLGCVLLMSWAYGGVQASLPEITPQPREKLAHRGNIHSYPQLEVPVRRNEHLQRIGKNEFSRLPGVCRRLRRRRITVLCNVGKYCSVKQRSNAGHLCRCPKGSKCSHFFLRSF